jgi:hypothetical protein
VDKHLGSDLELTAWVQYERYNVPLLKLGQQSDTVASAQFTWYPQNYSKSF